jgi:hypothetical protein
MSYMSSLKSSTEHFIFSHKSQHSFSYRQNSSQRLTRHSLLYQISATCIPELFPLLCWLALPPQQAFLIRHIRLRRDCITLWQRNPKPWHCSQWPKIPDWQVNSYILSPVKFPVPRYNPLFLHQIHKTKNLEREPKRPLFITLLTLM